MYPLDYFGQLELPLEPFQSAATAVTWQALWADRVVLVAAVLVLIICAKDIALIFPHSLDALLRFKANRTIQHSWHLARSRVVACLGMTLPFCIVSERYALVPFGWWSQIAALAAYLVLRRCVGALLRSGKLSGEDWKSVLYSPLSSFVPLVALMMATAIADAVFHFPVVGVRTALFVEMGIFFFAHIVHEGEFLRSAKSGLTTFLYLCALELVCAGAVVAAIHFV